MLLLAGAIMLSIQADGPAAAATEHSAHNSSLLVVPAPEPAPAVGEPAPISMSLFVLLVGGLTLSQGTGQVLFAVGAKHTEKWTTSLSANNAGYVVREPPPPRDRPQISPLTDPSLID